jgi:hypothetical protein
MYKIIYNLSKKSFFLTFLHILCHKRVGGVGARGARGGKKGTRREETGRQGREGKDGKVPSI